MFRKSLIALSLLGVASQGAASTLTVTEVVLTPQAATTLTEVASSTVVLTTEQASIADGAVAKITFSKAPTNAASISTAVSTTGSGGVGTCGALSYSGASNSGLTLNYTMAGTTATGCTITLGDNDDGDATNDVLPTFAIADVSSTPITVSASFSDIGDGIDPASAVEIVTKTAADQYSLSVDTEADATVDVETNRYNFTPDAADTIVLSIGDTDSTVEDNDVQNGTITGAALTGVTYVLTGNFAWAEDTDEDPVVPGFQLATGAVACTGGGVVTEGSGDNAPTSSSYTFSTTTGDAVTCTLTPQDDALAIALPTDDFEASATVAYNDVASPAVAGTQSLASVDAGEWDINGASVKIFSVPFGTEVESHSIFVSNKGDSTGAITGSMVWNGNDAVTFDLGNIQAKANKYLNVIDALTAIGEKPAFGRADITFTVNAPAAQITFTAAYNTAEGRANLYMEQQANIDVISENARKEAIAAQ